MPNSLWPHGLRSTRLHHPSLLPGVCLSWCPWSQLCHPTISFSVTAISSCPQSFPAYVSFPMSQLLAFQIHLYKQYLALIDSYVIKMAFLWFWPLLCVALRPCVASARIIVLNFPATGTDLSISDLHQHFLSLLSFFFFVNTYSVSCSLEEKLWQTHY